MRRYPALDIVKLYTEGGTAEWNAFLTKCLRTRNIDDLAVMRYRLQAGMDDLSKAKMNSEKIIDIFLRWQRSLETTAKKILRIKHPNPCDNPLQASSNLEHLEAKRRRDNAFESFLRKSAY